MFQSSLKYMTPPNITHLIASVQINMRVVIQIYSCNLVVIVVNSNIKNDIVCIFKLYSIDIKKFITSLLFYLI